MEPGAALAMACPARYANWLHLPSTKLSKFSESTKLLGMLSALMPGSRSGLGLPSLVFSYGLRGILGGFCTLSTGLEGTVTVMGFSLMGFAMGIWYFRRAFSPSSLRMAVRMIFCALFSSHSKQA